MATATATKMTADEFYELAHRPENLGRNLELERGEVIEMASPEKYHGFLCGNVAAHLWTYARQQGRGYICTNDSGIIVEQKPDTVRGPDVSFYDDDQNADSMDRKYGDVPPRLVVEVRSPSDTERRMRKRISEYLRMGIPLVWLIEPEDRFVTVYEPQKILQVLDEGDELTGGDVLPEFKCTVADLFKVPAQAKAS